jgi:hypothetical protein
MSYHKMAANASYSVITYASYVLVAEGGIVVMNINIRW